MPAFIGAAIVAGVASGAAAVAAGTATAFAFSWSAFAAAAVMGAVAYALADKPRGDQLASSQRLVTTRQAAAPWEAVVGRARKGGILTFRYISPDRRYWHMVVTLACHPSEAIDEVYADGEIVSLNAQGFAQGKYAKTFSDVNIVQEIVPGSPYQITVPTTVTSVQGVFLDAYGDGNEWSIADVSPNAPASQWEYSRSGSVFTFHSSIAGKPVSIATYDSNDDSWLRIKMSLGDEAADMQPFPELVAESQGLWSDAHRQYGHTKVYVRCEANPDLFATGVPNFTFTVRGAKDIYDPRTDTTGWSDNAALVNAWYLTNAEIGPGFDYAEEIDEDDLIAAANDCDDAVALLSGGSEKRYSANGVFLSSETPKTILEQMLSACAGTLTDLGDRWRINVGVYHAPTVTLEEGDLVGPSAIKPHLEARESANGVKGLFTDPQNHWQTTDFPAIQGAAYLAEDGGIRAWRTLDLSKFVTSISQAQRLAKIDLLRLRQSMIEEGAYRLTGWQVVPGKTVARTDAQLGWSAKPFEVLNSELAVVEGDGGPVLAVKLSLRETAAAVFDWSTSDEQRGDLAPNTSLPDPGAVPAPGEPAIAESLETTRDGRGVAVKVTVSWAASSYPFGATYRPEYKASASSEWTVLPLTRGLTAELFDIAPGMYDFRVQALASNLGASSEYAISMGAEVSGLTAAPAAPTGISIQAGGGTALITINQSSELDVLRGGRVLVRFCEEGVSPAWESAFSIGKPEGWPGDSVQLHLPLKQGTYLVKFRDSTGHESATWAEFYTKQASQLAYSTLSTLTFDPGFSGSHSGTQVDGSDLTLGGLAQFDDITDLDAVANLDEHGGIAVDGTWTATTGMDLTSVQRGRLTSYIEGVVDNALDQVDDRATDVDSWLDFDGASFGGSAADAWLEMRETDDDPSGSPAWSSWKRVDATEFEARAFQFRARLVTSDLAYRPLVSALEVTAEAVA